LTPVVGRAKPCRVGAKSRRLRFDVPYKQQAILDREIRDADVSFVGLSAEIDVLAP
jgi:hypothetical protein